MKVAMAEVPPVDEFDAQLERPAGRADECVLVDAQQRVERLDRRDRRLPYPHGSDLFGFDDCNRRAVPAQNPGERGGGHPPRRAAADDRNTPDGTIAVHAPDLH